MPTAEESKNVLEELAMLLRSPVLPVQSRIAGEIGEDQPFVSNASRGVLKRVTDRVTKLYEYASSRVEAETRAEKAAHSVDAEVGSVQAETIAVPQPPDAPAEVGDSVSNEAMSDLRAYLNDGYDPRLIVEQLVVLRRAQQLRRPGRHRRVPPPPAA